MLLGGALLAPWLFELVQCLTRWHWCPPSLVDAPFRRIHHRALLLVAVGALWPLLRAVGIVSWRELGLVRRADWWRHVGWGVGLGCLSFAAVGGLLLALGTRRWETNWYEVGGRLGGFAISAVVVALVEEVLFRGGLQGALTRAQGLTVAIVVTSAVYASAHFLKPNAVDIPAAAVGWASGFQYSAKVLGVAFRSPADWEGLVTLFLAGTVLSVARVRTAALYLSIGVHGGWVFTQKTFSFMTHTAGPPVWWGGGDLVDNLLVWPLLIGLLGVVVWLTRTRLQPPPA